MDKKFSRGGNFKTYEEARNFFIKNEIGSGYQWRIRKKSLRISNIPSNPDKYYRDKGWNGWMSFLGKKQKKYLQYEDLEKIVKSKNFSNLKQWRRFYIQNKEKIDAPSNPDIFYKNRGWKNWGTFLGHGLKTGEKRKYNVNECFFKKWSHDMAYILGFWWADGCIQCKNGYRFVIELGEKDAYILDAFSKIMESEHKIYKTIKKGRSYHKLYITSKKITLDIKKLGGKERKTLNIKFPNVPKEYLSDFIRGYFDGDGTVFFSRTIGRFNSAIVSASKKFAYKLFLAIKSEIPNIKIRIYKRWFKKSKHYVFILQMGEEATLNFGRYMYGEFNKNTKIKLLRKFEIFSELYNKNKYK